MSDFEIMQKDSGSQGRSGLLKTGHGDIETPAFMPVGTGGAVKGITPKQLKESGARVVLANAYHLMLRPGVEVVEEIGGLHRLMSWDGPILTDSGGYQLFSLSRLVRVDDGGVEFASHIDGERIFLDAEKATEIQNRLGADIIMCLDECTGFPVAKGQLQRAVDRTIAWARRCKEAHCNSDQQLFAVVQGAIDLEMRAHCAGELVKLDFDGYAVGGVGVGEGYDNMIETVARTTELLPEEKPRYLMGVGTPTDIIAAVRTGIDMFDCVLPTRNGRNAFAFTKAGPVRLRNNAHIRATEPIEADCDCYCCKNFGRGSIRHFFNTSEMLGPILVSIHNLRFYQRLMATIREKIKADEFSVWANEELKNHY
ncbi:MAG: tRNA guanosine(34) transglycosylase Tgt [Planctomycetes bacterium]|nr:tRNA guanosine(34) transglycosylase Tgt [Planctomycetota bacterium]MBL7152461.1 tRNA guanosine(34) transglycosylase Tgt [Phycisphaerae bacterium]